MPDRANPADSLQPSRPERRPEPVDDVRHRVQQRRAARTTAAEAAEWLRANPIGDGALTPAQLTERMRRIEALLAPIIADTPAPEGGQQ